MARIVCQGPKKSDEYQTVAQDVAEVPELGDDVAGGGHEADCTARLRLGPPSNATELQRGEVQWPGFDPSGLASSSRQSM